MIYIILLLIGGINLAPFVFPQLDIWHAQGIWSQVCILILFSLTFITKPKFTEQPNLELGILHFWIAIQTAFICFVAQVNHKYDITHFFPYFNFLCLVVLYKIIVQYVNILNLELCLIVLRYALIATLLTCVLQYFNTSQFFQLFFPSDKFHNNPVVGFIGNGTHLSGFLAMMIPVFLYFGKREDYLCLVLMGILLTLTGTSTNDPSICGWIVGLTVISFYFWHSRPVFRPTIGGLWILAFLTFLLFHSSHFLQQLFSLNGRSAFWLFYLPIIKQWFVTGAGLGSMNAIYQQSPFPEVRHLHMEYLQMILETGIISVIIVVALIKKFFEIRLQEKIGLIYQSIFLGFCVSACFNYPMHLWLTSVYACFAYAAVMVIKRGEYDC